MEKRKQELLDELLSEIIAHITLDELKIIVQSHPEVVSFYIFSEKDLLQMESDFLIPSRGFFKPLKGEV